jgi:hypothetical protein
MASIGFAAAAPELLSMSSAVLDEEHTEDPVVHEVLHCEKPPSYLGGVSIATLVVAVCSLLALMAMPMLRGAAYKAWLPVSQAVVSNTAMPKRGPATFMATPLKPLQ